ncbi:DgyrCDS1116 [Dimorphilus gyrociliatus]|uniref:DgyrCDS1116 n=1 Tax=Dimorphilus gyrociliatus TaxID=2664684 RepID=A0A7I8V852_9ANNE|nr:DgyrCDS1116 [Dimorphilus gyrociliatus]
MDKKRRKKRHTHGLKTVELMRGRAGYGFTISGQQPCVLSCVVPSTPADRAGLRTGDFLLAVNNLKVADYEHDDVVRLIGSSSGLLVLQIAENYSLSDSSDEELTRDKNYPKGKLKPRNLTKHDKENLLMNVTHEDFLSHNSSSSKEDTVRYRRVIHSSREGKKHTIITRQDRLAPRAYPESLDDFSDIADEAYHSKDASKFTNQIHDLSAILYPSLQENHYSDDDREDSNPPFCEVLVGYIGSIEMPEDAMNVASSRMQSIRNALKRLRCESRVHTLVVIQVDSNGVRLKNAMRQVMVTYPAENIAYSGSCPDDKRFFGIVTVTQSNFDASLLNNSCHAFMIDPDMRSHTAHMHKAKTFGITCVPHPRTQRCLQFPKTATPIMREISKLYRKRQQRIAASDKKAESLVSVKSKGSYTTDSTESSGFTCSQQSNRYYRSVDSSESDVYLGNCRVASTASSCTSTDSSAFCFNNRENIKSGQIELDSQNSAENLRRHALKIMQTRVKQTDTMTDTESVKSNESRAKSINSFGNPDGGAGETTPTFSAPPLPPKSARSDSETPMAPKLPPKPPSLGQRPPLPERKPFIPPRRPITPPPILPDRPQSTPPRFVEEIESKLTKLDLVSGRNEYEEGKKRKENDRLNRSGSFKIPMLSRKKLSLSNSHESLMFADQEVQTSQPVGEGEPKDRFESRFSDGISNMKEELGRVASWAIGFDRLLADEAGMMMFSKFLEKEYSDENIIFWKKCEEFRTNDKKVDLKQEAQEIFDKHLSSTASLPINVDSFARQVVEEKLAGDETPLDVFNIPQKQIYSLMKQDSYPRFIKSEMYRRCVVADMQNKPLPLSGPAPPTPTCSDKHSKITKKTKSANGSYGSVKTDDQESKRRRSLLPWTKSKSEKKLNKDIGKNKKTLSESDSKSNLSILSKQPSKDHLPPPSPRLSKGPDVQKYCRIILPDRSTTVLDSHSDQSLYKAVCYVCDRRKTEMSAFEAYELGSDKPIDLHRDLSDFTAKEIRIEERVTFTVCLNTGKVFGMRGRPEKSIKDTLRPVLLKSGLKLDGLVINIVNNDSLINHEKSLSVLNRQKIIIQTMNDFAEWGGEFHYFKATSNGKISATAMQLEANRIDFELQQLKEGKSNTIPIFDDQGVLLSEKKDSVKREGRPSGGGFFGFFRRTSLENGEAVKESKKKTRHSSQKFSSIKNAITGKDKTENRKSRESLQAIDNKSGSLQNIQSNPKLAGNLFEMIENIQGKKIEDQCGPLLQMDLPDFLRKTQSPIRRTESDTSIAIKSSIVSPSPSCQSIPNNDCSFTSVVVPTPNTAQTYFSGGHSCPESPELNESLIFEKKTKIVKAKPRLPPRSGISKPYDKINGDTKGDNEIGELNLSELEVTLMDEDVPLKDSTMTMIELDDRDLSSPPPSPTTHGLILCDCNSDESPPPCEITTHMLGASSEFTDSLCII